MHIRLIIFGRVAFPAPAAIPKNPWIYIPPTLSTLAILPNTKLICGGPDSHDRARKHLHKLVCAAIVIITGVWSPVSGKKKNISFNPIDMSAKALASRIIGHRGHPGEAEPRRFVQKNLLCSSLLSRRQTIRGPRRAEIATRDAPGGPPWPPIQGGRAPLRDSLNGFH